MPEISLVKGLSGREALDSMLHELRQKLMLNGRFGSNMSYPGYRAVLRLEFYPAASFVPPVEQTVEVQSGFIGFDGVVLSETATVNETVEIPVRSPNQVREESGMKVPVLSQDAQGNSVEKWVDPKTTKGKPPKNVVKGGNLGPEPAVTMVPTAIVASEAEAAVR